MIDIDDIYEACRYCYQHIIQFRFSMLLWREAIRPTRLIQLGPMSMFVNGALIAAAQRMKAEMQASAQAIQKIEQQIVIKPLTLNHFNEFDLRREKRKAQWKDETRMRNGRNWKR